MNGHRIRRLPVVDPSGKMVGIVSRRDLLSVFLRPDEEIAAEMHEVLNGILLAEPDGTAAMAGHGVVNRSGAIARPELTPAAERLATGVDGVVAVTSRLTAKADSGAGSPGS